MTDLPTRRILKKLSLRAAVALSLRATQRVAQLLPDIAAPTKSASNVSDERVFNIGLLLVKSFCDGGLHGDSTRLAEINEDTKWDPKDHNSVETDDPVLRSGNYTFSATMGARFGHFIEPDLPTFSTAQNVIDLVYKSLTAALEASVVAGEQYRSSFLEGTWRDYELLRARSTALFPEYGPPIDTTEAGPLGSLWRGIAPALTSAAECEIGNPEASLADKRQGEQLDCNYPTTTAEGLSATETASPQEGYLYKYVSFQTLLKVLENATLRFSPVSEFNDPFDGQLLPIRKFGWTQFFGALRDEITRLVTTKDESIYSLPSEIPTDDVISFAAMSVKELQQSDKEIVISPERFDEPGKVEPLSKLLRPMIYLGQQGRLGSSEEALACLNRILDRFQNDRMSFSLQDADRRIIPAIADFIQVLCLSEVPNSLLMWSHYTDQHTGAVLKFDTCSETAGYFAMARPIIYEKELPSFEEPRSLARRYLGLPTDTDRGRSRQVFTKSLEWAYEKEWRVMVTDEMREQRDSKIEEYKDAAKQNGKLMPFQPESLSAIYLGCRVTTPEIRSVLDLVINKSYPTDVYVAVKDDAEFAISFVPLINGRARTSAIPKMDIKERESLYRSCLDAYFDFWNEPGDDVHGERRRVRNEGVLADYGPPNSKEMYREMIQKLQETFAARPTISVNKEKEPEEWEKQRLKILQPSTKAYGALEDALKEDLAAQGGTLPEHQETPELNSD